MFVWVDCKGVILRRAEISAGNRAKFIDRTGLTRDSRFTASVVQLDVALTASLVVLLNPGTLVPSMEAEMPRFLWPEAEEEVG